MSSSTSVPIKIIEGDLGSAQIHTDAVLDGDTLDFQIDTGSNYTSVANTGKISNYKVSGTSHNTSAANVTVENDKIVINSFKIGAMEKINFEVVRYKPDSPLKNRLGMNALTESRLTFDFKKLTLTFGLKAPNTLKNNELIFYSDRSFGLKVNFVKDVVEGLWDTGAELSCVDSDLITKYPTAFKHLQTIENGVDATGHPVKLELYQVNELIIGGYHFSGVIMAMDFQIIRDHMGPAVKFILGTNLIRQHNWYFDQENKIWSFED